MTDRPKRKRLFPEVDFTVWNFDLGELLEPVLEPIGTQVAEIIWDDLRENFYDFVDMRKQGPCLTYYAEEIEESLVMPFAEMRLHSLPGDYEMISGEEDNERADLKAAIASAIIGVNLFTKWSEQLTDDLGKLLEIQAAKYPEDAEQKAEP
jgi:hypothetical protein